MFAEHLGAAQQRDQLGRPPPVRPHQQARPVHLEPEITARALHPVDHPGIQQLISKLAVLAFTLNIRLKRSDSNSMSWKPRWPATQLDTSSRSIVTSGRVQPISASATEKR